MSPYSGIAEQIKQAREDAGITQKELAALAGINQGSLSRLENGIRKRIDYQCLSAIAKALDIQLK
jgi:transcriptional regulator with XRE-family HTH domain